MTLVEMLVSSVLLATVMVVLIQAVSLATRFAGQSHHEAHGLRFLEAVFVMLQAGGLPMNEDSDGDFEEEGWKQIRYEVKSESDSQHSALFKVQVTIFWPAGTGEASLTATRLFAEAPQEEDR